jgi:hypothetical protein
VFHFEVSRLVPENRSSKISCLLVWRAGGDVPLGPSTTVVVHAARAGARQDKTSKFVCAVALRKRRHPPSTSTPQNLFKSHRVVRRFVHVFYSRTAHRPVLGTDRQLTALEAARFWPDLP